MNDDKVKVKIAKIRIELSNNTVLDRDESYIWRITGSNEFYPRHIKLMLELNNMLRESDQ